MLQATAVSQNNSSRGAIRASSSAKNPAFENEVQQMAAYAPTQFVQVQQPVQYYSQPMQMSAQPMQSQMVYTTDQPGVFTAPAY